VEKPIWKQFGKNIKPAPRVGRKKKVEGKMKTLYVENCTMVGRKIRIHPTQRQRRTILNWMNAARWTYNAAIDAIATGDMRDVKSGGEMTWLRNKVVNRAALNKYFRGSTAKWLLSIPADMRGGAIQDVVQARKTARSNKVLYKAEFKHRSKRDRLQSIRIHSKHWGLKSGMYSRTFGKSVMRSDEPLPEKLSHQVRVVKNRVGKFYIILPVQIDVPECRGTTDSGNTHSVIALDPGVRSFMTGYRPDGSVVDCGIGATKRFYSLRKRRNMLLDKAKEPDVRHRQRYHLKRAALRVCGKIRNLVDDAHRRFAKWLCKNNRVILIPKFNVAKMVKSNKLGPQTKKNLLTWSHFRFREYLISKAREYRWCRVVVTEEPWTSKTCGKCGQLNHGLGASKTFVCSDASCAYEADRDENAARNILLRYLTLSSKLTKCRTK